MSDLKFTPKKDEELSVLLKEGAGSFEVVKAEKRTSQTGNPMIALLLRCWDSDGNQGNIFEYLILNDNIFSQRKIKHFCYCVGLGHKYESGELNAIDCENRSGNIIIGISSDKKGKYPPKNNVYDFIKKSDNLNSEKINDVNKNNDKEFLDDLPF